MIIIDSKKAKSDKNSGDCFVGTMDNTRLLDRSKGSEEFRAGIAKFPPGTRIKFHIHDREQILYILDGKGLVATEGEERVVKKGDIILIPAKENHSHGATKDSSCSQLYIINDETKTTHGEYQRRGELSRLRIEK